MDLKGQGLYCGVDESKKESALKTSKVPSAWYLCSSWETTEVNSSVETNLELAFWFFLVFVSTREQNHRFNIIILAHGDILLNFVLTTRIQFDCYFQQQHFQKTLNINIFFI